MQSAEEYLARTVAGQLTTFDLYLLRVVRAAMFGGVAALASGMQLHASLSPWRVGLLIFLLSLPNRYAWLGALALVWLLILCFLPPELAGQMGSWIRSIS